MAHVQASAQRPGLKACYTQYKQFCPQPNTHGKQLSSALVHPPYHRSGCGEAMQTYQDASFNTKGSAYTAAVLLTQQQQEYMPHPASARTEQLKNGEKLQTSTGTSDTTCVARLNACPGFLANPCTPTTTAVTGDMQIRAQAQGCTVMLLK